MFQTKIYKGKKSNGLANGIKSEILESAGVSIETIAATRIQTAFRAYKVCQSEKFIETNQVKPNFLVLFSYMHTIYVMTLFIADRCVYHVC